MTSNYKAQKKYDALHTVAYGIKLNKKTDYDIISYLDGKEKQTTIKKALRLLISQDHAAGSPE